MGSWKAASSRQQRKRGMADAACATGGVISLQPTVCFVHRTRLIVKTSPLDPAHPRAGRQRLGAAWPRCRRRCSGGGWRPWWGCPTWRRPASSAPPWPPTWRLGGAAPAVALASSCGPVNCCPLRGAVDLPERCSKTRGGVPSAVRGCSAALGHVALLPFLRRRRQRGRRAPCSQTLAPRRPSDCACDLDCTSYVASAQAARPPQSSARASRKQQVRRRALGHAPVDNYKCLAVRLATTPLGRLPPPLPPPPPLPAACTSQPGWQP